MLNIVANDDPKWYNIHLTPQYKFVYLKSKKIVKYIGKFETMNKDFIQILKDIKIKLKDINLKIKKH